MFTSVINYNIIRMGLIIVAKPKDHWQLWNRNCDGSVDCIQVIIGIESFYYFSLLITGMFIKDYAAVPVYFMFNRIYISYMEISS